MFSPMKDILCLLLLSALICEVYSENVIVIGGGAAGLAAASKLYQNGLENVTIVEANPRLGGRMYSLPAKMITRHDKNGYLEMGAQWIHGQIGSPSYKIAFENGLVDAEPTDLDGIILAMENEDHPEENDDLWTLFDIMEEEPEDRDIFPGYSVEQYILTHKSEMLYGNISEDRQRYVKPFLDLYNRYLQGDWVSTWDNLSYKAVLDYDVPGGPEGSDYTRFKANHCYADLMNILQADIPRDHIHLHSPVTLINYTDSDTIWVELEDGSVMATDKVIFTGSLGVLKDQIVTFDPALPKEKQEAIEMVGFGVLAKIYLEFDQPWASEDWLAGFSLMFPNTIEYSEADAEEDWTRFISGIYKVDFHPNIAELWIGGHGAIKMESLSGYKLRKDIESLLRRFKPSLSQMTNTSKVLSITVRIHIFICIAIDMNLIVLDIQMAQ